MKTHSAIRTISNSAFLSYVYFNPIYRASRTVRKKLKRHLRSNKVKWPDVRPA